MSTILDSGEVTRKDSRRISGAEADEAFGDRDPGGGGGGGGGGRALLKMLVGVAVLLCIVLLAVGQGGGDALAKDVTLVGANRAAVPAVPAESQAAVAQRVQAAVGVKADDPQGEAKVAAKVAAREAARQRGRAKRSEGAAKVAAQDALVRNAVPAAGADDNAVAVQLNGDLTGALAICTLDDCGAPDPKTGAMPKWVPMFVTYFLHSHVLAYFEDDKGHDQNGVLHVSAAVGACTVSKLANGIMTVNQGGGAKYLLDVVCESGSKLHIASPDQDVIAKWAQTIGAAINTRGSAAELAAEEHVHFPNVCIGVRPEGTRITKISSDHGQMDTHACQTICDHEPLCIGFAYNRKLCTLYETVSSVSRDVQSGLFKFRGDVQIACPEGTQVDGKRDEFLEETAVASAVITFLQQMFPDLADVVSQVYAEEYTDADGKGDFNNVWAKLVLRTQDQGILLNEQRDEL
jgi:hypothetical protein